MESGNLCEWSVRDVRVTWRGYLRASSSIAILIHAHIYRLI